MTYGNKWKKSIFLLYIFYSIYYACSDRNLYIDVRGEVSFTVRMLTCSGELHEGCEDDH